MGEGGRRCRDSSGKHVQLCLTAHMSACLLIPPQVGTAGGGDGGGARARPGRPDRLTRPRAGGRAGALWLLLRAAFARRLSAAACMPSLRPAPPLPSPICRPATARCQRSAKTARARRARCGGRWRRTPIARWKSSRSGEGGFARLLCTLCLLRLLLCSLHLLSPRPTPDRPPSPVLDHPLLLPRAVTAASWRPRPTPACRSRARTRCCASATTSSRRRSRRARARCGEGP